MPVFGVLSPIYKKDVILNMKYEYYPKRRAEQERRELNEQILRLLQSGACEQAGVTDEDIFNRYTGDGGLHGLRRSDYDSYNAFSAAKKELENGQFFTPPPLCEMIVSALLWGDRIFEKCGIRRDEEGDGGKTLEIRGKRRLSARDGGANYQQS